VLVRRVVSGITPGFAGDSSTVTHTARDGTDAQVVECYGSSAMPRLPRWRHDAAAAAGKLTETTRRYMPSIRCFALTLGLSNAARIPVLAYSTSCCRRKWRAVDYAQGTALMGGGTRKTNAADVDRRLRRDRFRGARAALCAVICGPDRLSNWDSSDMDAYREKRGRWQQAIVGYLSSFIRASDAVVASSFNTARRCGNISMAPDGAVYGFGRHRHARSGAPVARRDGVPGVYLASAYAFRRLFRRGSIRPAPAPT